MADFNPFKFEGRIGRLQYFGFGVIWVVILYVLALLVGATHGGVTFAIALLVVYAVATVSYGVRRLHDFDRSGWWYLVTFVPYLNFAAALVFLFMPGTQGPNRFGVRSS